MRFFFLSLIAFSNCFAQSNISGHGSYCITAICRDGIFVASDSRLSLTIDENNINKQLGYVDTIQKIFYFGKMTMVVQGQLIFDGVMFSSFVEDFSKNWKMSDIFLTNVGGFFKFMKNKYPKYAYLDSTTVIFSGYQNKIPQVLIYAYRNYRLINDGVAVSDDKNYFNRFFTTQSNARDLMKGAELSLEEYANRNQKNKTTVGKPMMMLKINPDNSIEWLKNKPTRTPIKTIAELCKNYRSTKTKINFLAPKWKEIFLKYFCHY